MARHSVHIAILLVVWIQTSLQQEQCEINSGLLRGNNSDGVLTAADDCPEGVIHWHYPAGSLSLAFPRALLPNLTHPRHRMKVCFRGRDLGDPLSVVAVTQTMYTRSGRNVTRDIQLPTNGSDTEWVCTLPCRHADGVFVTMSSVPEGEFQLYMAIIHYKAETVLGRRGSCGHRGPGCMRGGGRGGGGRGGRRGGRGRGKDEGGMGQDETGRRQGEGGRRQGGGGRRQGEGGRRQGEGGNRQGGGGRRQGGGRGRGNRGNRSGGRHHDRRGQHEQQD